MTHNVLTFRRCESAPCIRQLCKGDSPLLRGALKANAWALRGPVPEEAPCLCGSLRTRHGLAAVGRSFRPEVPLRKRDGAATGHLSSALPVFLGKMSPTAVVFGARCQSGSGDQAFHGQGGV